MKRWMAVLALCVAVVLVGGGAPTPCWGTSFITFTDTSPTSQDTGSLSYHVVWYASWTQTVATTDTAIGAIVRDVETGLGPGTAWLTNAIGPGATSANVIANATFTAPELTSSQLLDLNTAPTTTLFSGLSLDPGTYYLVLKGPELSSYFNSYEWLGDYIGVAVTTVSGFSVGPYGWTVAAASFPPSSSFTEAEASRYLFYSVEGTAVPVPPTMLLLGSGLLGLVGWRKLRKS